MSKKLLQRQGSISESPQVILDTNVLVSGIFWSGPPYQILQAWQKKQIRLIASVEILEEYRRVFDILSKKYKPIDLIPFIEMIARETQIYKTSKLIERVSIDPDDDKFIACALAGEVTCIVSGDKDLLAVSGYKNLEIIKPQRFVLEYLK